MQLSEEVQREIMERFRALTPEEMSYLDQGIDKNAGLVLLYNIIPEADSVLMAGLPALKDHQFDPNRLLHGSVTGQSEHVPDAGPEGPPMPVEAQAAGALPMEGPPQPMPMEEQAMPMDMAQGALGGLPIGGA